MAALVRYFEAVAVAGRVGHVHAQKMSISSNHAATHLIPLNAPLETPLSFPSPPKHVNPHSPILHSFSTPPPPHPPTETHHSLPMCSGEDEVASTAKHTISKATSENFCKLCIDVPSSFGVGGCRLVRSLAMGKHNLFCCERSHMHFRPCRSEYYTNKQLAKCGIPVGTSSEAETPKAK
jgi:hypothetical protein